MFVTDTKSHSLHKKLFHQLITLILIIKSIIVNDSYLSQRMEASLTFSYARLIKS